MEEAKMKITDVKIRKIFDEGPMKAIASVTFDGQLAVHDVKVINVKRGASYHRSGVYPYRRRIASSFSSSGRTA